MSTHAAIPKIDHSLILRALLEQFSNDLEALHPMNPSEPCLIYSIWSLTRTTLHRWDKGLGATPLKERDPES